MIINVLNVDEFINENGWKEVKLANYFISNTSENHPDGIISNEIFGMPGSKERKENWGWINLNDTFMSPQPFYVLQRLKVNIANDMKLGLGRYYVDSNGELTKLNNGETMPTNSKSKEPGTGFRWLKENWPNIEWKITKGMTKTAITRRQFLANLIIDEIFIDKYPVMPAFYRDVDYKNQKRNIINKKFYSKMVHLSNIIKNTDELYLIEDDPDIPKASNPHIKMQDLISEIYLFFIDKVGGANGFIHRHVIGKATDYGARLVISAPNFNIEHYKDAEVGFDRSSIPLAVAINIFAPFTTFGSIKYITNIIAGKRTINYFDRIEKIFKSAVLDNSFMDDFSVENIRKYLNLYKKSKLFRLEPVTVRAEDGKRIPIQYLMTVKDDVISVDTDNDRLVIDGEETSSIIRDMNWCEFFYIVSEENISDKCTYNTRYPVLDFNGTYPSRMTIIPSIKYVKASINGIVYKRFPILTPNMTDTEIEHSFTDSLRLYSIYMNALGADFDGDQLSAQSTMTDEANEDAVNNINSLANVVGIDGKIFRDLPQVAKHGLYGLTYKIRKPVEK